MRSASSAAPTRRPEPAGRSRPAASASRSTRRTCCPGKSLELGLYNGDEVDASGVTGISLTVTGNGTNLASSPINSASQFTDNSINLGALGTSGNARRRADADRRHRGGRRRVLRRFPPRRSAGLALPLGALAAHVERGRTGALHARRAVAHGPITRRKTVAHPGRVPRAVAPRERGRRVQKALG